MSHIATIDIEFKDLNILKETCKRLSLKMEQVNNYRFYDGNTASGTAVYLEGWKYPMVITGDGKAVYDNYNGSWGKIEKLNTLKQYYGVEKSKKMARLKGMTCREVKLENGQIKLFIQG
jgi:gamma-glutamylcyclotransferase (GGCT)/AIG2-like uncharacterized protein YtfP